MPDYRRAFRSNPCRRSTRRRCLRPDHTRRRRCSCSARCTHLDTHRPTSDSPVRPGNRHRRYKRRRFVRCCRSSQRHSRAYQRTRRMRRSLRRRWVRRSPVHWCSRCPRCTRRRRHWHRIAVHRSGNRCRPDIRRMRRRGCKAEPAGPCNRRRRGIRHRRFRHRRTASLRRSRRCPCTQHMRSRRTPVLPTGNQRPPRTPRTCSRRTRLWAPCSRHPPHIPRKRWHRTRGCCPNSRHCRRTRRRIRSSYTRVFRRRSPRRRDTRRSHPTSYRRPAWAPCSQHRRHRKADKCWTSSRTPRRHCSRCCRHIRHTRSRHRLAQILGNRRLPDRRHTHRCLRRTTVWNRHSRRQPGIRRIVRRPDKAASHLSSPSCPCRRHRRLRHRRAFPRRSRNRRRTRRTPH